MPQESVKKAIPPKAEKGKGKAVEETPKVQKKRKRAESEESDFVPDAREHVSVDGDDLESDVEVEDVGAASDDDLESADGIGEFKMGILSLTAVEEKPSKKTAATKSNKKVVMNL